MRWCLLTCLLSLLTSCDQKKSASSPPLPAGAVAMVGDSALLQSDLDYAQSLSGDRAPAAVLDDLVSAEAMARLARAEGIDQEPSVRAAIRRLLVTRLQEKHLTSQDITAGEMSAAVQDAPPPPARPATSHIAFLRRRYANSGEQNAASASLEEARAAYQALPADPTRSGFGPLAVTFSDDNDTRYQGGNAGWITANSTHILLPPEVVTAAVALPGPGLVPGIIQSSGAAWLVLVMEVKSSAAVPLDPAKLRLRLVARKEAEARAKLASHATLASSVTLLQKPVAPPAPPAALPPLNP